MDKKDKAATDELVGKGEQERKEGEISVEVKKGDNDRTEWFVGTVSDFEESGRAILYIGNREIGVLQVNGHFYAYSNVCLHQGGPVCEGSIYGKVEPVFGEDHSVIGERFSEEELHIVCPWHGFEYDIATGECVTDRSLRLKSYEVVQRGDEIYVVE